nr:T9SS type A sorting domain-containing protein [Bacteroidota bacterium]
YVFNILGKQIVYQEFNADGFEKVKLEGAAGSYLLKLVSGNEVYTTKVLTPISAH